MGTAEQAADTTARAIADFVVGTSVASLPAEVVALSRHLVLDTVGVMIAALDDPVAHSLRGWATRAGQGECLSPVGTRLSGHDAAMVTSSLMHALDYDDMGFGGHGSSCVLGAVLARAERARLPGADVLTGYAVGMEIFGKLDTFDRGSRLAERGWHATTVRGLLGATAGVARAAGCTAEEATSALAIAVASGAAMTGNFGSMVKPLHAGFVAGAAIRAVDLAAAGIVGSPDILNGISGFSQVYLADALDWNGLVESLGRPWRFENHGPTIKQFPSCAGNHRALASAERIRQEAPVGIEHIERVEVHVDPALLDLLTVDWPADRYEAKFSLRFNVCAALLGRARDLAIYEQEEFESAIFRELGGRVVVCPDRPGFGHRAEVVLRTTDNRVITDERSVLHGSAQDPMTEREVLAKFERNARNHLAERDIARCADVLLRLDDAEAHEVWGMWRTVCGAGQADHLRSRRNRTVVVPRIG